MSKHSPGPWSAICTKSGVRHNFDLRDINNCTFALLKSSTYVNSNLIAAAPDLLEALEALLADEEWFDGSGWVYVKNFDAAEAARKAIARAKGESQ